MNTSVIISDKKCNCKTTVELLCKNIIELHKKIREQTLYSDRDHYSSKRNQHFYEIAKELYYKTTVEQLHKDIIELRKKIHKQTLYHYNDHCIFKRNEHLYETVKESNYNHKRKAFEVSPIYLRYLKTYTTNGIWCIFVKNLELCNDLYRQSQIQECRHPNGIIMHGKLSNHYILYKILDSHTACVNDPLENTALVNSLINARTARWDKYQHEDKMRELYFFVATSFIGFQKGWPREREDM